MKLRKGLVLRDICGEKAVIAEGLENIDFSKMLSLNDTAAFIWETCTKMEEIDEEKICDAILTEYDEAPSREEIIADIRHTLANWEELGLVE